MRRRALATAVAAWVLLAVVAPRAFAHAQLKSTSPARGAVLAVQPKTVAFRFDESVEGKFGAIKVFDAGARRVDDGDTRHPAGEGSALATGLKPRLPEGTYTATYRVISSDGHPVEGGVVFSIGRAGSGPAKTIDQLIGSHRAGPWTRVPFGLVRTIDYLALALALGVLGFLRWCWRLGLPRVADGGSAWLEASEAVATRGRRVLLLTVCAGISSALLGLVFEGATAAGTTFWDALHPTILRDLLSTRFGTVWGLKGLVWLVLGALLVPRGPLRALVVPPAARGGSGAFSRLRPLAFVPPAGALAVAPALAGHARTSGNTLLLVPSDVLHVVAMSVWLGGLAALLLLVPRATARLVPADRTSLLAAVLVRFSPLALACVLTLMVSGTVQSVLYLTSFGDLLHDAFGRAVLIKIVLIIALAGLGAINRQKVLPKLRHLAADGSAPGSSGHLLRRTLRAEVTVVMAVLITTGALVGYAPPSSTAGTGSGPQNISKRIGPAQLEVTTEPARVGPNTMHVYLFDARSGAPYTATKQLTLTARQRGRGIGPIPITLEPTGPGHYTAQSFQLVPGGTWTFALTDRVSDFDQYATTFTVKVTS
ncbi:MAG: copper resistance protein CopC [Solirubrobacterales bacterium]|nr:copper resistance protein CopC [Solirubrobacterales bacterium]